jgi:hypothetical protein
MVSIFQSNDCVVSRLIWLELDLNPNHAYFEKRSLDCQRSTGLGSNVSVEVPVKKVVFLEFVGLVFDTGFILKDDLEDGRRTSLDKID